ncbi:hypothetical protein, partial [Myroides sp. NP-2]|uniref:hypothetical protein n=1 Tax=Myroides sp. NP-2 TaxID=2759945 RepID=UPI001C71ECD9
IHLFSNPLHESTLFLVCSSLYYFKQTYYLTLAYEIWAWSGGYVIVLIIVFFDKCKTMGRQSVSDRK